MLTNETIIKTLTSIKPITTTCNVNFKNKVLFSLYSKELIIKASNEEVRYSKKLHHNYSIDNVLITADLTMVLNFLKSKVKKDEFNIVEFKSIFNTLENDFKDYIEYSELHIKSGNFDLLTLDSNSSDIIQVLKDSLTFAAKKDVRYYLNGVLFDTENSNVVATDGHRLFLNDTLNFIKNDENLKAIVPHNTIKMIVNSFKNTDISISLSEKFIYIRNDSIDIVSKLIDERYPDYTRVIPNDNIAAYKLKINPKILELKLKECLPFSNSKFNGLRFTLDKNSIKFNTNNENKLEFNTELLASNYTLDTLNRNPLEIGFNIKYMLDVLKQCKSDIIIKFSDHLTSMKIECNNNTFVIMPMRL